MGPESLGGAGPGTAAALRQQEAHEAEHPRVTSGTLTLVTPGSSLHLRAAKGPGGREMHFPIFRYSREEVIVKIIFMVWVGRDL